MVRKNDMNRDAYSTVRIKHRFTHKHAYCIQVNTHTATP